MEQNGKNGNTLKKQTYKQRKLKPTVTFKNCSYNVSLCTTIVQYDTEQFYLPSYSPDNHHSSDVV